MMIVMFGNEVGEVDNGHGLLESRMESGSGKFRRSEALEVFHHGAPGNPEPGEDNGHWARVVVCFVGLAILKVGGMKGFGAELVIDEAVIP